MEDLAKHEYGETQKQAVDVDLDGWLEDEPRHRVLGEERRAVEVLRKRRHHVQPMTTQPMASREPCLSFGLVMVLTSLDRGNPNKMVSALSIIDKLLSYFNK